PGWIISPRCAAFTNNPRGAVGESRDDRQRLDLAHEFAIIATVLPSFAGSFRMPAYRPSAVRPARAAWILLIARLVLLGAATTGLWRQTELQRQAAEAAQREAATKAAAAEAQARRAAELAGAEA